MYKSIFILNLSRTNTLIDSANPQLSTAIKPPSKLQTTTARYPDKIPSGGPLVLYIVGHGAPNLWIADPPQKPITEFDLATAIQANRGDSPTLIVWDFCYAKSFLQIPGITWGKNYTHIFCCQEYERTWHTGEEPRRTVFSIRFQEALEALSKQEDWTWQDLQNTLRAQYGRLQKPEITLDGPPPSVFFTEQKLVSEPKSAFTKSGQAMMS